MNVDRDDKNIAVQWFQSFFFNKIFVMIFYNVCELCEKIIFHTKIRSAKSVLTLQCSLSIKFVKNIIHNGKWEVWYQ